MQAMPSIGTMRGRKCTTGDASTGTGWARCTADKTRKRRTRTSSKAGDIHALRSRRTDTIGLRGARSACRVKRCRVRHVNICSWGCACRCRLISPHKMVGPLPRCHSSRLRVNKLGTGRSGTGSRACGLGEAQTMAASLACDDRGGRGRDQGDGVVDAATWFKPPSALVWFEISNVCDRNTSKPLGLHR